MGHRPLVFMGSAGIGQRRAPLPGGDATKRVVCIVMAGDFLRAFLREDVLEDIAEVITEVFKGRVEAAGMGDGGEHVGKAGIAHIEGAERIDK